MEIRISQELYTILLYARDEAMRTGSYAITADHLLLGLPRHEDNAACLLMKEAGLSLQELKRYVDSCTFRESSVPYDMSDKMAVGRSAQNVINLSAYEALKAGSAEVASLHLLLALSGTPGIATAEFFSRSGISHAGLVAMLGKHGWSESVSPSASDEESAKKSIETQMRSMVVFTYPTGDDRMPS